MSILPKAVTFLFLASGFAPNLLAQTLVVKDVDNESFKVFTLTYPFVAVLHILTPQGEAPMFHSEKTQQLYQMILSTVNPTFVPTRYSKNGGISVLRIVRWQNLAGW